MNQRLFGLIVIYLFVATGHSPAFAQSPVSSSSPVVASGESLIKIGDGFSFTEGPTADASGDVYFTDQPNDRIVKYSFADQTLSDWMKPCGRSNGLFFAPPNQIIACADANNELWRIDLADKSHRVLVTPTPQQRMNGPNDCWVDQDGAIYFTDPLYKRAYWTQEIPADSPRGLYRLSSEGTLTKVADDLIQPNGIIGDVANRVLYVADMGAKKTYRYSIAEDGSLENRTLFCSSGSDGMTIDSQRNVYLTGGQGVTVFDPQGKLIETIQVPARWTANVTFAGPQRDQLFITAGDSVYTIKMSVQGL
ncbi:SMP-30/gluconolactonase/LRE family protein [Stieleria sp. TO1_6]|uniref:SMP-30/gluconolactonase/LRE family protein n=1 Tax=Stieleria tagensis TaxID=2956795 RepID=UPI00209AD8D5|nr:SMP-30/gluconolactonase/LRE family protein [Stieleria tagensis]MCO8125087.1 SMP-30/gluconolactonase/LRE family protein [Stieleria tagensis]